MTRHIGRRTMYHWGHLVALPLPGWLCRSWTQSPDTTISDIRVADPVTRVISRDR